jgi:hypothetical protein
MDLYLLLTMCGRVLTNAHGVPNMAMVSSEFRKIFLGISLSCVDSEVITL